MIALSDTTGTSVVPIFRYFNNTSTIAISSGNMLYTSGEVFLTSTIYYQGENYNGLHVPHLTPEEIAKNKDRQDRYELSRKTANAKAKLLLTMVLGESIVARLDSGQHVDFLADSGVTYRIRKDKRVLILHVTAEEEIPLYELCVYFLNAPEFDRLCAIALMILSGIEGEIILHNNANRFEVMKDTPVIAYTADTVHICNVTWGEAEAA